MNLLSSIKSKQKIVKIIIFVKWNLYNQMVSSRETAIRGNMKSLDVEPLPSVSTINRILRADYYTHERMGSPPEYYKKYFIKKMGSNTFLKLESLYRLIGEAIFYMISTICKFIEFLWKKEEFILY